MKYEQALKVLQQAKDIYQRNIDYDWRKMIKAIHPMLQYSPAALFRLLNRSGLCRWLGDT
jgi:hypothetical protein